MNCKGYTEVLFWLLQLPLTKKQTVTLNQYD